MHEDLSPYHPGDRIVYIGEPVFDEIIVTGEIGVVERVDDDWVWATWPRSGLHAVPLTNVRPLSNIDDG